jgi:hypothetical protein
MKGDCRDAIWSSLPKCGYRDWGNPRSPPPISTVGKPAAMSLRADQKRHPRRPSWALAFWKVKGPLINNDWTNPRQFRNRALQPLSYPDMQHQPETFLVSVENWSRCWLFWGAGYLLVIASGAFAFNDTGVEITITVSMTGGGASELGVKFTIPLETFTTVRPSSKPTAGEESVHWTEIDTDGLKTLSTRGK